MLTKYSCTYFLVLMVSYIVPITLILIVQHVQQQGIYIYIHILFQVFLIFPFIILCVRYFPIPLAYMSLIHYNGSVFYIKNWRFFTLFCFLNTFCLIFYKFTLGGSGYKRFVCTVAAFVCHLFDTLVLFWYWDVLFEY